MATKKTATKETTKAMREAGMKGQKAKAEKSEFEAQLEAAQEGLSTALAWRVKLSTHLVVLPNGKTRKYISVDSGMPRDVKVALFEGKNHSIPVKAVSRDKLYTSTPKQPLDATQSAYNEAMTSWAKKCGREAKNRIEKVLADAKGFDALWGMVELLERNEEIKKSEVFFS
jgi:hypothetical protein